MLIPNLLFQTECESPNKPAVWHKGDWLSYQDLGRLSRLMADKIRALGIEPGDRVAILFENSFEYIIAHFGALAAGAVEVSLNTEISASEHAKLLADCDSKGLIASKKFLRKLDNHLGSLPALRVIISNSPFEFDSPCGLNAEHFDFSQCCDSNSRENWITDRDPDDLASIVYTSGSTGKPKGVMLSHHNLMNNMYAIVEYLNLREDDRMLAVLPFHYIYGKSLLYTQFLCRGSLAIENRFAFPSVVLKTMKDLAATCFAGVPSTFSILMNKTAFPEESFPKLRLVTQAGGPMPTSLQRKVADAIKPAKLLIMYGSTEAAPRLTYLDPGKLDTKLGSIGKAISGVEIIITDDEGNILPRGEIGELRARGPNIMQGYWKDPEGTQRVLQNGYYRTEDLGYEDEEGYIFLTGRRRDIIKVGGNRVSAKEIEEIISEIPDVHEVAVVGIEDDILGEAIKAYIVMNGGQLKEADFRSQLRQSLPNYKVPSEIEFIDNLPKNESGKILKSQLLPRK